MLAEPIYTSKKHENEMDIENIIDRYLSGTVTNEDREILLQWLEKEEDNRIKFGKVYDIWLYSNASLAGDDELEAALSRFRERTSGYQKKTNSLKAISAYIVRIAASVIILLSVGYSGYVIGEKNNRTIPVNRLLTGEDGKGKFVLPDGTTVWLNANSMLEYPESFTGEKRLVRLEGEGLFEVTEDVNKPFFVQAGSLETEVLGTRFLVNNYSYKPVAEAILVNGSVKIDGDYFSAPKILYPGQLLTYNKRTQQTELNFVDTDDYTNWIHSKLVFDKTNLAKVIINLEKWYGIDIVASTELTRNVHMSFTVRRESLDEILKYMSVTAPVTYKWKNDVLYLSLKK
jgi:ferric-dicitrate binding protein FerR (iron transport regulator)